MIKYFARKIHTGLGKILEDKPSLAIDEKNARTDADNEQFIPAIDQWVSSHYFDVVNEAANFCGNIFDGSRILNVGCGEMLTDFGLLRLKPDLVMGLDISPLPQDHFEKTADKLRKHGIEISDTYRDKLRFTQYDGSRFPFSDGEYDVIFSWSAFEHVKGVDEVLSEIYRVLSPNGKAFIQVYPWYTCLYGSHLSDWIDEPYFHLHRSDEWVLSQLEARADTDTANKDFILKHMWPEYKSLNRISVRDFYKSALGSGFKVAKARLISHDQDLSSAPPDADFADLMIAGTMMLLSKQ